MKPFGCRLYNLLIITVTFKTILGFRQLPIKAFTDWPSSSGTKISNALDGNASTQWISSPCAAGGWRSNPYFNPIFGICSKGMCSGTCDPNLAQATDGSPYTAGSAVMSHGEGRSWASILLPNGATRMQNIYVRGAWPVNTTVMGLASDGTYLNIAQVGPALTYLDLTYAMPNVPVSSIFFRTGNIVSYI